MQLDLIFRHINDESHESTREYIQKLIERHMKSKLDRFNLGLLRLHATIELHKQHYNVTFRLHLPPKKVLVAHDSYAQLRPAIDAAMDKLSRQVEKHYAHISGREDWSRKIRRKKMKKLEVETDQLATGQQPIKQPTTEQMLESLLPRLASYIKHEMTYLQANGDIQSNYPTVADILDESYLKVRSQISSSAHTEDELYQVLLKSTTELLQREVNYEHDHENDLSIDSSIPKGAQQQAEDMVEEDIHEFYQPDEVLHIEDLIPTRNALVPEQQLELEAIDSTYRLLATMPNQWRQVVTLVYREQIEIVVVAETILNIPVDEIRDTLNIAEAFIHTHLEQLGLAEGADLAVLLKP